MPFKSDAQRRLMQGVAHSPEFAKKVGIPQSVGKKFVQHKAEGGLMATKKFRKDEDSADYKAKERRHVAAMEKHGVPKNIIAEEKREAGLKKGGCVKKYAMGGDVVGDIPVPYQDDFGEPDMPGVSTMPAAPYTGDGGMGKALKGMLGGSGAAAGNAGLMAALQKAAEQQGMDKARASNIGRKLLGGSGATPQPTVRSLPGIAPEVPATAPMRPAMAERRPMMAPRRPSVQAAYAKGGKVRKIDGCATKGKTRGKMV